MSGGEQGQSREAGTFGGPILADAHVHFYDCFDQTAFFDGALANFQAAAAGLGISPDPAGCLLFTEAAGDHAFGRFHGEAGAGGEGPWSFHRTEEDCSLIACRDGREKILLLAGRQIATAEDLEVLAIACGEEFADRQTLQATLDAVRRTDTVAVVPWGFGKWWFRRGAILSRAMEDFDPAWIYLGDNAGRPGALPTPGLLQAGQARDLKVLPGTDPLPFASEAAKAGAYGLVLDGALDRVRPAESFKSLLQAQSLQPRTYGRLERLGRFCRNQVLMQIRKRM